MDAAANYDMSKKQRRLIKTKAIKKAIRRNRRAVGVAALTLGGLVIALSPKLRERTRSIKEQVVTRLGTVRKAAADRLTNGSGEHEPAVAAAS